tara:strand:+ start:978 stop:1367 length:390 start_codon:yes stop_codon:yes gene_type:complete
MATLTAGITLSSTDITNDSASVASDTLSVSLSNQLSVLGNCYSYVFATSTTSAVFLSQARHSASFLLLHNQSSTTAETIKIELADGDNDFIELGAGEFAFFPWNATHDLYVDAAQGTPALEVRLYQKLA